MPAEQIIDRAVTNIDVLIAGAVIGYLAGRTMMKRKMRRGGMGMGGGFM